MTKVLFVCVHNSGRSQMAEAFFNYLAKGKGEASSAGTKPSAEVNPTVVRAMQEVGLDISGKKPKLLTMEMLDAADRVFTMGCGVEETCPGTFVVSEDWQIEDPHGKPIETVRRIRVEVKARVEALIKALP